MIKYPDGKLKPGNLYIVVNIDEPYAEKVLQALAKGEGHRWLEPSGLASWAFGTWGVDGLEYLAVNSKDYGTRNLAGMLLAVEDPDRAARLECFEPADRFEVLASAILHEFAQTGGVDHATTRIRRLVEDGRPPQAPGPKAQT